MVFLAVPDHLFETLKGQNVVKCMKSCREINIAFIPYEEKVKADVYGVKKIRENNVAYTNWWCVVIRFHVALSDKKSKAY